jgi:glucose/arabinose dehydrogenase
MSPFARWRGLAAPVLVFLGAALGAPLASQAQVALKSVPIVTGLVDPVWAGSPPGDSRLFVVERQPGRIRIVQNGTIQSAPFLDIGGLTSNSNEGGLLGLAFHPSYEANGQFFVNYTDNSNALVTARYRVATGNPNQANPASAQILLSIPHPGFDNHNGGDIHFGPFDGYLYISTGDGGGAFDPACNAQNLGSLLGKILRIDVSRGTPYSIPASNPFVGVAGARPEIWLYGLRNPWRWRFDRATGEAFIGDVGQDAREEINHVPAQGGAGASYGWRVLEGGVCQGLGSCATSTPGCSASVHKAPIFELQHNQPGAFICSIIGGARYRGCAIPELQGTYFFSDYCADSVWSFRYQNGQVTDFKDRTAELAPGGGLSLNTITAFGESATGEILIVDQGGEIYRIERATPVQGADCDGNGQIDACEIATYAAKDLNANGALDACESLSASTASVSIAQGGAQFMDLHAGPANAGKLYYLLGSLTGTKPGVPIDAVLLPLALDAYTQFTLTSPGVPPLSDTLGLLDNQGRASALINLPGGLVPTVGIGANVYHAYLIFDPGLSAIVFASNWIKLRFDA